MPGFEWNFTEFGTNTTSTGVVNIKSGPTQLHAINILSSGTGSVIFYNATTSSTGNEVAVLTVGVPNSYTLDLVLQNGLSRGITTSTAEITVAWA